MYESDPGPSVLSAVGAVLHISHMTAPNLALPDRTGLTSHRTHTHTRTPKYFVSFFMIQNAINIQHAQSTDVFFYV